MLTVKKLFAKFLSIRPIRTKVLSETNSIAKVAFKPDFKPASELSKEEYEKRYPNACQKCKTPNSISTNGWFCEQCIHDMSYNSYLDVYGKV
jgi:ribosomal protein L37AE/L43A